ncbi:MAG: DUF4190 domain-containing protein [Planctomycetota bacterium]
MNHDQGQIEPASYRCSNCGYDLSGSAIGGFCPECGTPVTDSIRLAVGQSGGTGSSQAAVMSLVFGLIGITACGFVAPLGIVFYYRAKADAQSGGAPASSMGMAKAGLILGWIGSALTLLVCLLYAFIFTMMGVAGP